MYKVVKRSRAVQVVILALTLFIMLTIYPLRLWNETIPSVTNQRIAGSSDSIGEDYLLQRFIAQYDHLGTVNLYIADFENGWNKDSRVDSFIFRMLDSNMEIMFEQKVDTRFIEIPGFCTVYVNEDLEVAKDYYFFLQGQHGSRVWFGLEETESAGNPYISRLVYNYDELVGYNIISEFNYSVPLRKDKVFMYDAILAVIALILVAAVEIYTRMCRKDKLVTVESVLRVTANLLVAAGTVAALWVVSVRQFFSGQVSNNIFYTVGTLLTSVTLFYIINHKRDRSKYIPLFDRWKNKEADVLQTVFFALTIWACTNYMNGLYEIHHQVAERQLMVFFALAAIVMCRKKEFFNIPMILYAVVAVVGVMRYHSIYVDYLAMDEWDIRIMRWGIAAAVLAGALIVSLLVQLFQKRKLARFNWQYGVILVLFFVLLVVFRNTRWWPVALVVSFTIFYIRYALWDNKAHLLQNICNGLILNFVCGIVFCMIRRPFFSWIYTRYSFTFHTVTVTAVYLGLVMCATFVKLIEQYRKYDSATDGKVWRYLWKELLLFGASATYMLFTCSRTGFLAVGVMMLVILILLAVEFKKARWKKLGLLVGCMVGAVVWCFPLIFTAQRVLPAICNNVYEFEVEDFADEVTRGNEWDSMYYITVDRFIEVFNNKLFDIPESGTSSYERSEEYQKYRAKRFNKDGDVVWEGNIEDMYAEEAQSEAGAQSSESADASGDTASGSQASVGEGEHKLNIIGIKTDEERAADEAAAAQRKKDALEGNFDEEEEQEEEEESLSVYEKAEEYANGRMDIFRAYLEQMNLNGHNEMGAWLPDGTVAVHAHNIYLQVAYDHGIVVGIVFLLVGLATFVQGIIYYKKRDEEVSCGLLPVAVVTSFAVAGLVEWIFHLCHPAGFVLMLVLAPLLFDMGVKKDKANEK